MSRPERTATLCRLAVTICHGRWNELGELRRGAGAGEPNRAWREVVLQTHLFAGFPRVVEAFSVLHDAGGLGALDAREADPGPEHADAGRALFDAIYAENAAPVRAQLESYHPVLAAWIEDHAYARVLARPGLDPGTRELVSIACLTALDQERQLAAHIRGALEIGVPANDVGGALDAVADLVSDQALGRARRLLQRFSA